MNSQLKELKSLTQALGSYQQQLNATNNVKALEAISTKIDEVHKKIDTNVSKSKGLIGGLGKGILEGFGITGVQGAVTKGVELLKTLP